MWKSIFLGVAIFPALLLIQGAALLSALDRWPWDSYDYQLMLDSEGYDCLKRVTEFPLFNLDTSFTPEVERSVLMDIYFSTRGKQWYVTMGWNSSTNNKSHCSWYGITCHSNTSYVKSIMLLYNNLNGLLPSNIWKIRNLMSLCTPGNPLLRGRLGDFLFGNMSNLLTIVLNAASIAGNIPEDFVKLRRLQNFLGCAMKGKGFSGRLPKDIGNMTELRALCISGNSFTGELPRSISKLRKLFYFDLRNTPGQMRGYLNDLLMISSLQELYVSGVHLNGELPDEFPENFRILVLPSNGISGTLPKTLRSNSSLNILNLANNQLTGDIPGDLVLLPNIDMIDMSQNRFSSINKGKPWSKTSNASVKSSISLAGNRNLAINYTSFIELFTRTVDFIDSPSILNLSFCDIRSPVLANMLYMLRLSTCDLRGNSFYGTLPDFFEDYSFLTYFDVSSNNLTGGLPSGIQSLISLQYLDISGNPSMWDGSRTSSSAFRPDFTSMTRPPEEDNFTCPEGRLTFNNGRLRLDPQFYAYKYCVCDEGFYGDTGLCQKCMDGGTCHRPVIKDTEDLRPNIMKVQKGYWPSPHPRRTTHLVKCPVPSACNPSDSCTCRLDTSPVTIRSNRIKRSLLTLTTTCNQSCTCHPGNTDRFCSRCQEGYYKLGGLCFQCSKKGHSTYFYVFIPIFVFSFLVLLWFFFYVRARPKKWFVGTALHFVLMAVMMLLEMVPAWLFKLNLVIFVLCMTSRGKNARSLISIALFYIQTVDVMVSSVNVWPTNVVKAQNYLSSYWNLYFPSLSCNLPSLFTPVGKFAFLLLLPLVCLAMVGLYFITIRIYNRFRPAQRRLENAHFKCRQIAFFCLSFSYFPIVKQTLSILRPCHSDWNVHYMPSSPWIECASHTYSKLKALGVVSVVLYVIGFPLIVTFLMIHFFPKRSSMTPEEREKLDVWLGPVYLPYKPKYRQYFEIFMLFRRLLLAIALSMISSSSTLQTFLVWLVLVMSAIIHLCLQPYEEVSRNRYDPSGHENNKNVVFERTFSDNVFEPLVLIVLSMSFMVLRFSVLDSTYANVFVWLVMVLNVCVLVALLVGIFRRLVGKTEHRVNSCGNCIGGNSEHIDTNAVESDNTSDEERRHLLPVDGQRGYADTPAVE